MNKVIETIYQRRSVRKYEDKPVSHELIVELLKAAMAAPSATNSQPLEFLVLSEPAVLDQIREKLIFAKYNAPVGIIVLGNPQIANNSSGKRFWQQDGSAAIENMLIAATSLGLGSVWIGIHPVPPFERSIRQVLNLPDTVFPLGMVFVGYPAEQPAARTQYKESAIHWGTYDGLRKRKKKDHNAKKKHLIPKRNEIMLKDLILKNRSYRRFDESVEINNETLLSLIELARFSASGSNKQPLKYILSNDRPTNELIFSTLAWAGALKDWKGPQKGEQPSAYIIILQDTTISKNAGVDHGIAAQSILLGAAEANLGGCMLGAVNRPKLAELLNISEEFDILLVLALGKPAETVTLVDAAPNGSTTYYRDEQSTHYVPKRSVNELIIKKY